MYNRYIPQPDGSYQCNRVPNRHPGPPPRQQRPPSPPPEKPCQPEPSYSPQPNLKPRPKEQSAAGFLQNLLPKSFDTGDLIVILLLLLLAGDCEEDRSTALLTLVLYLFM